MNAGQGITLVGASAGSGKTHRLTMEVTSALRTIDVEALVAVTFTRKAHAELEERIRQTLAREDAHAAALRLPLAYLGTVHAVALRLLQEFALDAGLSPNVDVVAGDETKLLRQAFERSLDDEARARLDALAARLELGVDPRLRRNDWVSPCAQIMDLARANRIAPSALPGMAEDSVARLLRLLPEPVAADGDALDVALRREIDRALEALEEDGTRLTAQAIELLKTTRRRADDGALRWSDWAKIAAIAPSKKGTKHVASVKLAAARYEEHPRFHDDLRETTMAIFGAAQSGLAAYQAWKRDRRVVDYIDMLDGALTLLEAPRVREELAQRLRFVVVDEFQDTSPIQLAFFVRLHALAESSVWVGDPKQCIFEFAGADPVLMDAVADWVAREGGRRERLSTNHRSRPALVHFCSELFASALARHGFAREDVVVSARRDEFVEGVAPLGVWALAAENAEEDAEAVAEGVRRLLDAPHATPVLDRRTGAMRPVRAGDIAVLSATNEWTASLAVALHARGLRVAVARAGLFDTPEGTLAETSLRWLLDPHDDLAAATIDALTGWAGTDPEAWLTARLREVRGGERAEGEWRAALGALRDGLGALSPVEALDGVIAALDLVLRCARWPDAAQRIVNIDALRGVADAYEKRCAQEREAATVAGLLRYFDDVRTPTLSRDEILPSDDQHVPADEDAVVLCTYHKSKGLEWPVVVLANLDRAERRWAFEATPETREGAAFDPAEPLAHRWIRYWPWPMGKLESVPLAERAARSDEGRAVALREQMERARLLYVGFTRARDHLVLAVRCAKGKPKAAWLASLGPELELPAGAADGAVEDVVLGGTSLRTPARVWRLAPERSARDVVENRTPLWFARPLGASDTAEGPPYRIVPSGEITDWPAHAALVAAARIGEVERFGASLRLSAVPDAFDLLGNAVHGFFAADVPGLAPEERVALAERLLDGWGTSECLGSSALLEAGDRLRGWISRRWPGARWHREVPIEGAVPTEHGERWLSGIIDLLVETREGGYVLVDHKSFPAPHEAAWRAKCASFIPQLAAYALLLRAGGARMEAAWIHLPLGGGAVECWLP